MTLVLSFLTLLCTFGGQSMNKEPAYFTLFADSKKMKVKTNNYIVLLL